MQMVDNNDWQRTSGTENDLSDKKVGKVIIVGAGLAGLTAADVLSSSGIDVEIFEEQPYVGGLASTFYHDGFFSDAGPHRFHTSDANVMNYIKRTLHDEYYTVRRFSGVWMFHRYHDWPLTIRSLLNLPLSIMLKAGADLFFRTRITDESFRSHVINRYGRTLYQYFFHDYTKKFIKYEPQYIHADWAKGGMDRAIIDKRIKMNNLLDVARSMLFPAPVKTEFIYPKGGGIDVFSRRLSESVVARGGTIHLGTSVKAKRPGQDGKPQIVADGREIDADLVLWTAPLPELLSGLELPASDLNYLVTIFYHVICDCPPKLPYQWCYYGDLDTLFCRISINAHLSPEAAPKGKHIIAAEVTGMPRDGFVHNPQALEKRIVSDLKAVDAIPRAANILGVHVKVLEETYPIYKIDYKESLFRAFNSLDSFPSYIPLGRTGSFWYNNMDHSILQAMQQARAIIEGTKFSAQLQRDFWSS
jgi:protoporphyrinogen oxidase